MSPLVFQLLVLAAVGVLIALQFRRTKGQEGLEELASLKAELQQKTGELGKIQAQLEAEKAENQEQRGKGKQLFAQITQLKAEYEGLSKECDGLKKHLAKYEAAADQREEDFKRRLNQLEKAERSLQEERARVIRQDEERLAAEKETYDRMWAEHESNVLASLTGLCKMPQLGFTYYTNTELPEGFDGSLKPDFMIEFLGQYLIFDAKVSKAESLQTYITNAVKSTAQKAKKNPKIASTIFLVVPTHAVGELKTFYYPVDGYSLYVISPESLLPILAALKRITAYDLAEKMDPQKRENIVNFVADMDFHINARNGTDLLMSKMGIELLERAEKIDPSLASEVAMKKQEKKLPTMSELKKLTSSITAQNREIQQMTAPKTAVKKKDLETGETIIMEAML